MSCGMDSFGSIGEHLFRCKDCGAEVESGIINISGHWAECSGKSVVENVMKIDRMSLAVEEKMNLVKNEFGVEQ